MAHHDPLLPVDPEVDASRPDPRVVAVIAAGGMVGASARYGVARLIPVTAGQFPWATFWTNLSGAFLLGFFLVLVLEVLPPTRYLRPFVATGILGAYTTMSTYVVETALLVRNGHGATAFTYALASIVAGVALAYVGMTLGRRVPPRDGRPA